MRPNSNKRSRGRNNNNNNNRRGGNNRSQVFDSNGPEVRIRGTAFQVNEKYMALAKDAASGGDLILAESYLQHAEHYQRIINSWNKEDADQQARKAAEESSETEETSAASNEETSKPAPKRQSRKKVVKDDELGLPASILTPTSKDENAMQDA